MLTPTRIAAQPTTGSASQTELEVVRVALAAEYEIMAEIGRGGMAIVYLARDRSLDREVAIKVLPVQFTFDQGFVERFQREARIAAQLEHPHIIPIHRVAQSGDITYLVMKLVRGDSLGALLASRGMLPAIDVRRMMIETASALGHAAKRGIVHRDVKPDNIMLDDDGRFIVTDFGIARSAAEVKLTSTGMSVGTPRYMSPEQARALAVDGRSDLYSLGVVAYEALVGVPPFEAPDALSLLLEHINAPVPRPVLRTDEERALYPVIARLLEKKPADRLQSADELIAALQERAISHGGRSTASARPLTPTRPMPAASSAPMSQGARRVPSTSPVDVTRLGATTMRSVTQLRTAAVRGAAYLRAATVRGLAELRPATSHARNHVRSVTAHAIARARSVTPRAWAVAFATVAALTTAYYGLHFATMHRSRCPEVATAAAPADATANAGPVARAPLSLLVDDIGSQGAGDALDVYYDVCGLPADTPYTTAIRVTQNGWLKGILRTGAPPVTRDWKEVASGPSVRRHRTIDMEGMRAGTYTLVISITDAAGRRRDREVKFSVQE